MKNKNNWQNSIDCLNSLIGILELERDSQLRKDAEVLCHYLKNPNLQIAVFGPFNHGKSTLLNALLGQKTLPMDLIPTTGAAIYVRYGEELTTKICLKNGKEIEGEGTKILEDYTILDDRRKMRDDVVSVEVECNHPFLKMGVEFLDLPGTNDREEQNELVKDKLLTADIVIHVLDARKLMTLEERENLRDWLIARGINTVVFVVNFLNLLTLEEQQEIQNRLYFVAGSFRSELPNNISNLYRVDALPALRARLKGDNSSAQTTGLATFESALQSIFIHQKDKQEIRLSRLKLVIAQIVKLALEKRQAIATEIETQKQKQQDKITIQKKAEKLIKQGWQQNLSEFQGWLYSPKLISSYQTEIALALQHDTFNLWLEKEFQPTVTKYIDAIAQWVNKGCEFFEKECKEKLVINLSSG
jgi:GTPase SAR1 family protein